MVELSSSFSVLFTSLSAKLALFHSIEKQVCLVSSKLRLIGADSDSSCVGASKINSFQVLPLLKSLSREDLLKFCRKYNIHFIILNRSHSVTCKKYKYVTFIDFRHSRNPIFNR